MNGREIPRNVGEDFARRHEMRFMETSAKEAKNVDELFYEIATLLTKEARENDLKPGTESEGEITLSKSVTSYLNWNCCSIK